jgi:hypothetical protein
MGARSNSIFADRPGFLNGVSNGKCEPTTPIPAEVGAEVTVRAIRQYNDARAFEL